MVSSWSLGPASKEVSSWSLGPASKEHVKITQGVTSSFSSVINKLLNSGLQMRGEFLANSSWLYFSFGQICLHTYQKLLSCPDFSLMISFGLVSDPHLVIGYALNTWLYLTIASQYHTANYKPKQLQRLMDACGQTQHIVGLLIGFSSPPFT